MTWIGIFCVFYQYLRTVKKSIQCTLNVDKNLIFHLPKYRRQIMTLLGDQSTSRMIPNQMYGSQQYLWQSGLQNLYGVVIETPKLLRESRKKFPQLITYHQYQTLLSLHLGNREATLVRFSVLSYYFSRCLFPLLVFHLKTRRDILKIPITLIAWDFFKMIDFLKKKFMSSCLQRRQNKFKDLLRVILSDLMYDSKQV